MSSSSDGKVPSVFITFRTPSNPYFPIHHKKTPQLMKVQPDSVDFPGGRPTSPTVPSEALIFSKAIDSFTNALTELLEVSTPEENEIEPAPQPQITKETVPTLKHAFETLQSQLQKGLESLPETKQPLPKSLLQAVLQTPVFIDQLKELTAKGTTKKPIIEESEIPIEFSFEAPEIEKALLEDLKKNIPSFVKTLQSALKELPPSLPPEIKEALELYLSESSLKEGVPQNIKPQIAEQLLPKIPLETKENLLLPKPVPLEKEPIQKSFEESKKLALPEAPKPLTPKPILEEVKELETAFIKESPNIIVKKPLLEAEGSLATPEPIKKKTAVTSVPEESILPEKIEKPLTKLPQIALREILENFYPLLRDILSLIENQRGLPKELVALLKQIPELIKELKLLFSEEERASAHFKPKLLLLIHQTFPNLVKNLQENLELLPESLFPDVHAKLKKLIRKLPLHHILPLLEKEILPEIKAPAEEAPTLTAKPSEKQQAPLIEQPLVEAPLNERALKEVAEELQEASPSELEKAHARHKVDLKEELEKMERGKSSTLESPKSVPLITVEQFREQIKQVGPEPKFSTEIPFAFIVPYVPNTPIHTNIQETKIPPHDPRKETPENTEGSGSKKSIQKFSYIPKGEAWEGDSFKEKGLKKQLLESYAISVYLVTNEQYAAFLTEQSKLKNVYVGNRGQVFSKNGALLCQTKTGSDESDIESEPQAEYLSFRATSEKENYPVVCVTYDGAQAFCDAGGFRLPTEGEWEKAASLVMTEENKVSRKFAFGFSQDEATEAFANYNTKTTSSFETHTTPVGFYNGKTTFMKEGVFIQTYDAISPFGCYDMSGNVWEWTQTKEKSHAITKGGCFASPEEDLKVFTKRRKEQNSLDGYTGFRVALS